MHRKASLPSKLALLTVAGAGLYLSSHYTDGRKVSNWIMSVASSPEANDKQQPARGTNSSRQRLNTTGFSYLEPTVGAKWSPDWPRQGGGIKAPPG